MAERGGKLREVVDLCSSDAEERDSPSLGGSFTLSARGTTHAHQPAQSKPTTNGGYCSKGYGPAATKDRSIDPIIFTSSPRETDRNHVRKRRLSKSAFKFPNSDPEESEDNLPEPGTLVRNCASFSTRTAAILAEITTQVSSKRASTGRVSPKRKLSAKDIDGNRHNSVEQSSSATAKKRQRLTSAERELRATEKDGAKQERIRAKEAEKEKRRIAREAEKENRKQEKELRVQEKKKAADLAEVNKSKVDKKITTPEMIVYLPKSIEGKSINNQVRELLARANAEVKVFESSIPGLVKWKQRVSRDFDEELSHWVRAARVDENNFAMCLLSGEQFCNLVSGADEEDENIEMHFNRTKTLYPKCQVIYLIEGLEAWIRRSRSAQNRAYQAAVRRMEDQAQQQQTQSRRRKKTEVQVDEEAVEDALLELQVTHRCKVQQTLNPTETAEYILGFTQQISLIRHG